MSKSWRENLKSQLKEKGITREGSKTSESSTSSTSTTTTPRKPRITTEKLQKQFNQLKKDLNQLKKDLTLPEKVYKDLWLIVRSELSKWRNKSDSMLGSINRVIEHFEIDLSKNPFDKLKGGSE